MNNSPRQYNVLATLLVLALLIVVPRHYTSAATANSNAFAEAVPAQRALEVSVTATSIENILWPLLAMKTDEGMVTIRRDISLYLDGAYAQGPVGDGCNGYVGTYTLDSENGTISFTDLQSTLMLCDWEEPPRPPTPMPASEVHVYEWMGYLDLLYDVTAYEQDGDELRLLNSENEMILLYGELPPVAYLPFVY